MRGRFGLYIPAVLGEREFTDPYADQWEICACYDIRCVCNQVYFFDGEFLAREPGRHFCRCLCWERSLAEALAAAMVQVFGVPRELIQNFIVLAMAGFFAAIVRAPITASY